MATFSFNSTEAKSFLADCDDKIQDLYKVSTTKHWKFEEIRKELTAMLTPLLRNVKVRFFGSRVIGVGVIKSDLDIFIDINGAFKSSYKFTEEDTLKFAIIERVLQRDSEWTVDFKRLKAHVPIINATYVDMGLNCE
jgi:predicted nucleotidyltransferase